MNKKLLVVITLVLFIFSYGKIIADVNVNKNSKDYTVATVDDTKITNSAVVNFYKRLPAQYKTSSLEELRPQLIEELINQTVIAKAARKLGYHKSKEFKNQIARMKREVLFNTFVSARINSQVTESGVRNEYQKSIALGPKKTEIKARHILVKTKSKALIIISKLKKGADFIKLAKKNSIGPSGRNGGDLGFFGPGQMVPPFSKAAFALRKGEFTVEPVKTRFGWHIIKVEQKRLSGVENYKQASARIRTKLENDLYKKTVQQLRAKSRIELMGSSTSKIRLIR